LKIKQPDVSGKKRRMDRKKWIILTVLVIAAITLIYKGVSSVNAYVETKREEARLLEIQKEKERLEKEKKIEEKQPEPAKEPKKPIAQERFEGHKGVREYKAKSDISTGQTQVRQEPYPDPKLLKKDKVAAAPASADKKEEDGPVNPNSVIRMDL